MLRNRIRRLLPAVLVLLLVTPVLAQETPGAAPQPIPDMPPIPADDLNRGTPLRSVQGFQAAIDARDFSSAAEFMDLRNLRGEALEFTAEELAERLSVIARRAKWIELGELLDDPRGRLDDGLPAYRDLIGIVSHDGNNVRLYMQHVPRGDGVFVWKISNATVAMIPALYETYGYPELVEEIRASMPDRAFFGIELFKWVITFGVAVATYLVVLLIALFIRKIMGRPESTTRQKVFRFFVAPFGIWAFAMATNTTMTSLGRSRSAEAFEQMSPIPYLLTLWVLFAAINLWRTAYSRFLEKKGKAGSIVLLKPAANALKLLVFVAALLAYLNDLGINITTLLAGLGVGGVAVALALQKPMEDIFGAITLYSQQPVRVGDFCRIGTQTGTIEEIGLRTTFVRTLANTRIAIPNSRLATEAIDNISARRKILYRPTLRLRYDATPDQIRAVLSGVREALEDNDRVLMDYRVRFKDIGKDALMIEVFAYFDTTDWMEYLELAESMNLKVLDIVASAGTSLSLPASTLKIEQGADLLATA